MQSPFYKQNKITKVDISLKQLLDVDTTNELYYRRSDNIFPNQILTSYTNQFRRDAFRFKYLTDLIVAGSGVTITNNSGIITISSTGGGGGTQGLQDVITQDPVLTANNTIDGGGFTQIFDNNYKFNINAEQLVGLQATDGTKLAQFNLYPQADSTNWRYDDGAGGYTAIEMTGVKMYIQTPNYASKANGDVLTLIDNSTGQVEFQTPTTTTGDSISPLLLMGG